MEIPYKEECSTFSISSQLIIDQSDNAHISREPFEHLNLSDIAPHGLLVQLLNRNLLQCELFPIAHPDHPIHFGSSTPPNLLETEVLVLVDHL